MPRYRPEISALNPYQVGRPIEEVALEYGLQPDSIIKLASNESPYGPFPGVMEAAAEAMASSNRYPDPDLWDLSRALAAELGVEPANLLFGNGSVGLLGEVASAVGGPGTKAIYGWPSFVMYRFVSSWAGSDTVEVPLDGDFAFDLDAIGEAIDPDTRVVYLCNPNNPTGTVISGEEIEAFVDSVPDWVLVVVDEAYHHYVRHSGYRAAVPLALTHPNVVVLRTFSKVYALAGQRIGYAVGRPETLGEIRKAQAPMSVGQVAQAAALASLGQPDELRRRIEANAAGLHHLLGVIAERGLRATESHANFVFFEMPGGGSERAAREFAKRGVIIRPMSRGWLRVTVGTEAENERFVTVLGEVLADLAR